MKCYAAADPLSVRIWRRNIEGTDVNVVARGVAAMSTSTKAFEGTWRLLSFEVRSAEGEVRYPLGKDAVGYLMYGRDGYMSGTLMQANRAKFKSADILVASSGEKVSAFDTYSSYCGTYEVKGSTVIHHVECSQLPNWSGSDQERFFEFSNGQERLTLRTPPMLAGGMERTLVAIWQRVKS